MKIIQTKYGRGVSADKNYKKGDVLAISEGIPLSENQMPSKSAGSPIWAYIFNGLYPRQYILALDWTSLMNHSDDPNVDYFPISLTQVKFIALKDINEGDELNINYGYDVSNHSKHFGIDEDKLVNDTQLFDAVSNMAPSGGGVDLVKLYSDCIEQDEEGNWRIISNKTGEYWEQKYESEDSAKAALRAYHARKVGNFDMENLKEQLSEIKSQLFDAPTEVKAAFNTVVGYFDAEYFGKGQNSLKETVKTNLSLTDKEFPSMILPKDINDLRNIKDNLIRNLNNCKIPAEKKDYELKLKVVNEAIRVLSMMKINN